MTAHIINDEFTFVTNNRIDFVRLFGKIELHAGLIVVVPNVVPTLQRALFEAAIRYLSGKDLVNAVLEVKIQGENIHCIEYPLP